MALEVLQYAVAFLIATAFACEPEIFAFSLSRSAGGAPYCFHSDSFSGALSAAVSSPAFIAFLSKATAVRLSAALTLTESVEIAGQGGTLVFASTLVVAEQAQLVLKELQLETDVPYSAIQSYGNLQLAAIKTASFGSILIEALSGVVEITDSDFSSHSAELLIQRKAGAQVSVTSTCFRNMQKCLVHFYSGGVAHESYFAMRNCSVETGTEVLHFIEKAEVLWHVLIDNSNFTRCSETLFGGRTNNIAANVVDSRFQGMGYIVNGSAENATFSFASCYFANISSPPFVLSSLKGSLTATDSIFTDLPSGPVFLISSNPFPPSSALLTVSNCQIANVTNDNYQFSGGLFYAVSVTVVVSDTEIWGLAVLKSGLFSVTAGVVFLRNVVYRDSSVSLIAFMDGMQSTIVAQSVTMSRVENNDGAVMSTLYATSGYWDNVTVEDTIDRRPAPFHDYMVLWVGFSGLYQVKNSYIRNEGLTAISMAATSRGELEIFNTTFRNVDAIRVFDVFLEGRIRLLNVTFDNAKTLCVINCAQTELCATVSGIRFTGEMRVTSIFSVGPGAVELSDTVFDGTSFSLFYVLMHGTVLVRNVVFRNADFVFCRDCIDSIVNVTDVRIERVSSSIMFDLTFTHITLQRVRLSHVSPATLFSLQSSTLVATGATIEDCDVDSLGGLITASGNSAIDLDNSRILRLSGRESIAMGLILISNATLVLRNCEVEHFNATLVSASESDISIQSCTFADGGLIDDGKHSLKLLGGVLRDENARTLRVADSTFTNISADYGGVLFATRKSDRNSVYQFYNTNVQDSFSLVSGGAIYGLGVSVLITHSRFVSNRSQRGGAVWVSSSEYIVIDSLFANNSAALDGGAIQHTNSSIIVERSSFTGNSAEYGPDFASQVYKIAVIDPQIQYYSVEAASGQRLQSTIRLGLFDELDQLITTDNSSQLTLFSSDSDVEGSVLLYPIGGVYTVSNLIVVAEPLANVSIFGSVNSFSGFVFSVLMRKCKVGEEFNNTRCRLCTNNMYSLDPSVPCKLCPETASCSEGFKLDLSPGYWRASTLTDNITPCLIRELCAGGFNSSCAMGHTGVLCNNCDSGFSKGSQLQCFECKSQAVTIVKGILTTVVGLVALVTFLVLKEDMQMVHTVMFDYLHIVRILANLNIYWPPSLGYLLIVLGDIGSLGLTAFADPCMGNLAHLRPVYSQLIVSLLYLFLLCGVGGASDVVSSQFCLSENRQSRLRRLLVESAYTMMPLLFMRALQLFACFEVDGVLRLIYDPEVTCWSTSHKKFAYGAAVPTVILCGIFTSTLLLRSLRRLKKLFPTLQQWKAVHLAFFQARSFALSCVLVFSNALSLPSQTCFAISISITTELILNSVKSSQFMYFTSLYSSTLISTVMFTFWCVIYDSQVSKSVGWREPVFVVICYLILFSPLFYGCAVSLIHRHRHLKRLYAISNMQSVSSPHEQSTAQFIFPIQLPRRLANASEFQLTLD